MDLNNAGKIKLQTYKIISRQYLFLFFRTLYRIPHN